MKSAFVAGIQVVWDSVSLGVFKTCPRKYQYRILEGYTKSSPHLEFGLLYHKALETLDHSRVAGKWDDEALLQALRSVLHFKSDHKEKNLPSLIRSIVYYFEQFREDPLHVVKLHNGKPAVELSFKMETGAVVEGHNIILSGHIDALVEFNDQIYVLDRKTTTGMLGDKYFNQYSPDSQMSGYVLAGRVLFSDKVAGGIIDAAQIGVGFTRFARHPFYRTDAELEEWLQSFNFYVQQAADYATAGFYPMNDTACSHYGGCEFRSICALSPASRGKFLNNFDKRPWDPMKRDA